MKRRILSPTPFPVADSVRAAQARSGIQTVFRPGRAVGDAQSEWDSLQGKGAQKNLVIS